MKADNGKFSAAPKRCEMIDCKHGIEYSAHLSGWNRGKSDALPFFSFVLSFTQSVIVLSAQSKQILALKKFLRSCVAKHSVFADEA